MKLAIRVGWWANNSRPCVIDKPNRLSLCPGRAMTLPAERNETLTLKIPKSDEIARAIWQRQHAALPAESLSFHTQWRDQSVFPGNRSRTKISNETIVGHSILTKKIWVF